MQVTSLCWRPDGKALAVGHDDGSIAIHDVEVRSCVKQMLLEKDRRFSCFQMLPLYVEVMITVDLVLERRCIASASNARCCGRMPILGSGGPGFGGMYIVLLFS